MLSLTAATSSHVQSRYSHVVGWPVDDIPTDLKVLMRCMHFVLHGAAVTDYEFVMGLEWGRITCYDVFVSVVSNGKRKQPRLN